MAEKRKNESDHAQEASLDAKRARTAEAASGGATEADAGITEYLSPDAGAFTGILKQRYTDFLVNEIGPDGSLVRLVDLGLEDKRDRRRDRREKEREANGDTPAKRPVPVPSDEQRERLVALVGQETYDGIVQLFSTGTKLQGDRVYESKDERTALHQLVREAFEGRVETKTTPDYKFVFTLFTDSSRGGERGPRFDKSKLGDVQEFVHFVLYKENKDTMEAANVITKLLRLQPRSVAFAGTKDRRGVTAQRACLKGVRVERINGLNRTLRGVKLGSFKYASTGVTLGDLLGNEFYITIRDVRAESEDRIHSSLAALKEKGFINYFGMQRFGTFSVSTHTVGKYVLASDWEAVCELLLMPQAHVVPESVEARRVWAETKDAKKALALMPKKCVAEQAVLRMLAQNPTAYSNAVMQIPRNLRVMYPHAYQSYVWNKVASERIKRFGLEIREGDLVIDDSRSGQQTPAAGDEDELVADEPQFTRARPVTADEIASGAKTVYDVVLPTPGFDVVYPENELKQVYADIMSKDGIDYLNMRRNIKEFSLAGNYRHIVARPEAVEWWIKNYSSPADQLVKTDLDLINSDDTERITSERGDGDKLAVVLKLRLGTSQYATMAIREVMKQDTSRRSEMFDVRDAPSRDASQPLTADQTTDPSQAVTPQPSAEKTKISMANQVSVDQNHNESSEQAADAAAEQTPSTA